MADRKIVRSYSFDERDMREAIIVWLKSKDMPTPPYVGDTPDCRWFEDNGKVCVEWTEASAIE